MSNESTIGIGVGDIVKYNSKGIESEHRVIRASEVIPNFWFIEGINYAIWGGYLTLIRKANPSTQEGIPEAYKGNVKEYFNDIANGREVEPAKVGSGELKTAEDRITNHVRNVKLLQAIYSGKKFYVECFPTDEGAISFPNSNMAVKQIELPEFGSGEEYATQHREGEKAKKILEDVQEMIMQLRIKSVKERVTAKDLYDIASKLHGVQDIIDPIPNSKENSDQQ